MQQPQIARVTEIGPDDRRSLRYVGEVWLFRELLYFFVWRDVKVRYKQTLFGVAWAILQPFMLMVVFTFVFQRIGGVSSEGVPYPLFSFAALVPWTLFSQSVSSATTSVVANANLISKVFFPRILLPIAAIGSHAIDFLIALGFLALMIVTYQVPIRWTLLLVPLVGFLAVVAAASVGILFSAANAKYRDIQYVVPFLLQVWLFASPVAYSFEGLSEEVQWLLSLNPMVGVISSFRWALVGGTGPDAGQLMLSVAATLAAAIAAVRYFYRVESQVVDVV